MSRATEALLMFLLAALVAATLAVYEKPAKTGGEIVKQIRPLEARTKAPNPSRKTLFLQGGWQAREGEGRWIPVPVPGILAREHGGPLPPIIYRREFFLSRSMSGKSVFLHLPAGFNRVSASLNGRLVGEQLQWGAPAVFDLTGYATFDRPNILELWYEFAPADVDALDFVVRPSPLGIAGDIFIEFAPPTRLENVKIESAPGGNGSGIIQVSAVFAGEDARSGMLIMGRILSPEKKELAYFEKFLPYVGAGEEVPVWSGVVEGVKLWSPDSPTLYEVVFQCVQDAPFDSFSRKFGVRDIETSEGGILFNGAPMRIRGVTYRPDPGANPAAALTVMENDLTLIRNMGFNAVRFIPGPPPPEALELCDTLGLLVFHEMPFSSLQPRVNPDNKLLSALEPEVEDIVLDGARHVSVSMWGAGGADFTAADGAKFVEMTFNVVRRHDWRPIYSGAAGMDVDVVDVPPGADVAKKTTGGPKFPRKKPLVVLSFGAKAVAGWVARPERWSEKHQLEYIRQSETALKNNNNVAGWFLDTWADYPDPLAAFAPRTGMNSSGIVGRNRTPKLAFDALHRGPAPGMAGADVPAPRASASLETIVILIALPVCFLLWALGGNLADVFLGLYGTEYALERSLPVQSASHVAHWLAVSGVSKSVARKLQTLPSFLIVPAVAAGLAVWAKWLLTGLEIPPSMLYDNPAVALVSKLMAAPHGVFHAVAALSFAALLVSSAAATWLGPIRPMLLFTIYARSSFPLLALCAIPALPTASVAIATAAAVWHIYLLFAGLRGMAVGNLPTVAGMLLSPLALFGAVWLAVSLM